MTRWLDTSDAIAAYHALMAAAWDSPDAAALKRAASFIADHACLDPARYPRYQS